MKLKLFFFPLSIVVSLLLFIYFIKPAWSEYSKNNQSIKTEEKDLKIAQKNKNILSQVLANYKEISVDEKSLLENSIPESIQEERILKELNDMAVDSGVKITDVSLSKVAKLETDENSSDDNNIKNTQAEISLVGNYFGLKKALYSIENFNRFVQIDNFSIQGENNSNVQTLTLSVVFFHKEVDEKSKVSLNSSYLESLLENGLETDVIKNYMLYREKVVDFNSIGLVGVEGKDNLFDSGVSLEGNIDAEAITAEDGTSLTE